MKLRVAFHATAKLFEDAATSVAFILNTVGFFLQSAGDLCDALDTERGAPRDIRYQSVSESSREGVNLGAATGKTVS